jgi:hypothetical protein
MPDPQAALSSPLKDAPHAPPVFKVQTVTVSYDRREDRIALNVADAQNTKQIIHLTRRLLDQVIPVLVTRLEDGTPPGLPAAIVQSMSQDRMRLARAIDPPVPPVRADPVTPRWLCHTIRLRQAATGLCVTLNGDRVQALLALSEPELRMTLDALHRAYGKADWTRAVFPRWMILDPATAPGGGPGRRPH